MASSSLDSITPFLTIWTRPRATIRKIVDSDATIHVLVLAAIQSALGTLNVQQGVESFAPRIPRPSEYFRTGLFVQWLVALYNPAGIPASWPIKVTILTALGGMFGIVWLYIAGSILKWTGRLLGGTATSLEVRAAIAWGHIPIVLASIFGIVAFRPGSSAPCSKCGFGFFLLTAFVVLVLWCFVLLIKCVSEVHRFSAWRGLGAVVLQTGILDLSPVAILFSLGEIARVSHDAVAAANAMR
ncbi:MAG: YIP1 family protein [Candidatus Binatus sp.]